MRVVDNNRRHGIQHHGPRAHIHDRPELIRASFALRPLANHRLESESTAPAEQTAVFRGALCFQPSDTGVSIRALKQIVVVLGWAPVANGWNRDCIVESIAASVAYWTLKTLRESL
eukprot:SAG31_NODE_24220_length_486_cov_1.198966_1_plen_116_part_00